MIKMTSLLAERRAEELWDEFRRLPDAAEYDPSLLTEAFLWASINLAELNLPADLSEKRDKTISAIETLRSVAEARGDQTLDW